MKIALFGTFDVDNYGDLLFPHIAQTRYPEHEWTYVSPTNTPTSFSDSKNTKSFREIQKDNFDLVIIGGGNIIHTKPTTLTTYQQHNIHKLAYPELWIGAAKLAIKKGIPYAFNAPSISYLNCSSIEKALFNAVLQNSSYISFREQYSCDFAKKLTRNTVHCVTDTAIEIANTWPLKTIDQKKKIVINLNQRYHNPIKVTAFFIDYLAAKLQLDIEIVVIGDCHGDIKFSKEVVAQLKSQNVYFIETQTLEQLAHRIGEASYFIGSSMHGFITALSYGTPALLILNDNPIHKFVGLIDELNLSRSVICSNWVEILDRIDKPAIVSDEVKAKLKQSQDQHWQAIINSKNNIPYKFKNTALIKLWKAMLKIDYTINKMRKLKYMLYHA